MNNSLSKRWHCELSARDDNRSVALLVTALGLRRRAPRRRGVLDVYFHEQMKIGIPINWRRALGRDLRAVEEKCLRLQRLMIGDPSARVMILDTFNESLIQALSIRHATLAAPYAACIRRGRTVPDYGAWLYHGNALLRVLPRATVWLRDLHNLRVKADLAHAKDQRTGLHTRPISFKQADALFKRAQLSWAELIREWIRTM